MWYSERVMLIVVTVVCWFALVHSFNALSHEAVVIQVGNGDGVLKQVCTALGQAEHPEDPVAANALASSCFDWAAKNMYAQPYPHDHS